LRKILIPAKRLKTEIDTANKTLANDERLKKATQNNPIPAAMNAKPNIHAAIL